MEILAGLMLDFADPYETDWAGLEWDRLTEAWEAVIVSLEPLFVPCRTCRGTGADRIGHPCPDCGGEAADVA